MIYLHKAISAEVKLEIKIKTRNSRTKQNNPPAQIALTPGLDFIFIQKEKKAENTAQSYRQPWPIVQTPVTDQGWRFWHQISNFSCAWPEEEASGSVHVNKLNYNLYLFFPKNL